MKKYKVSFYYTEYGSTVVEVKTNAEAEEKVYKHLEDNGLEKLSYDCTDRDYDTPVIDQL